MDSATVLSKSPRGVDELVQRTGAVPQKLRSVLILVDGKTCYSDLLRKCSFIPQIAEHLTWLLQHGFIEPVPTLSGALPSANAAEATSTELRSLLSPPRALSPKNALLKLAHELLGVHADAVVQRLQDTADTHDALAQTIERCYRLIRLSIDETKAEQFRKLGSTLLVPTV